MSAIPAATTTHNYGHVTSQLEPHPPSLPSNKTKNSELKHSGSGSRPQLNLEPQVSKSANKLHHEALRHSSVYLPTPPNSARSLSTVMAEERLSKSSGPLPVKWHLDSPLYSADIPTQNFKHLCHNYNNLDNHDIKHKDSSHCAQECKNLLQIEPRSKFTNLLLQITIKWPFLQTVISEKDSRRIFYFMSLNFCFMLVQAFYGFLTDSLGLISDSIHMFFDCLALGIGLFAAIASKWPPSPRFPFGFGKIESLSGFGNGIFLVLISIEIMIEAVERLMEGREAKRLGELFTVSSLGFAVNLIGMACFGHHGHAGHGCKGHTHNHSHSDSHSHLINPQTHTVSHDCGSHIHDEKNDIVHDSTQLHDKISQPLYPDTVSSSPFAQIHTHSQSHSHEDDNMHGIFLHLLADTLGSAAVILSTALIYLTGFTGWDPIASCVIAALIFLSSIPLIKRSAKTLLLTLPDDREYSLRNTLASISDLRGVSSYHAPRFWLVDTKDEDKNQTVNGVIHILATRGSDLDDIRVRTQELLQTSNLDVVIQVENDNNSTCWCK
ncbi:Zinc transporter 5 [Golovinomyces cichoracearum]|uniref:Zinc transporter n=1 Tax=Golovinomyces cichoracearum TaxID=62708 RepID=A0A420II68_9PEZI|nr:Zinc transporter 5 [Golovinomyces cichoracearum]